MYDVPIILSYYISFLIHSNPENVIVDAVDQIQKADKPKIESLISEFIRLELQN